MREVTDGGVTALLIAARDGDEQAFQSLFDRLYAELRRLAHTVRARHEPATFNTTELVHEAYLKLVPGRGFTARDRLHFFRIAARAMRQVLVDAARRRSTRAEQQQRLLLEPISSMDAVSADILALDAVLTALEAVRPRQASVVECRFFAGLSIEDTAAALDISEPTVKRDWRTARAWLADALEQGNSVRSQRE